MSTFLVNEELVLTALHEVIDPELGVNIVDLGLIYRIAVDDGRVAVTMTLTTPGCPLHASIREAIERCLLLNFPTLEEVEVNLVWEPRWQPTMITAAGREELGWY